jgi:predicted GNAT family acetyltransferase
MELHRFDEPAEFYSHAEPFLVRHEAHNHLLLGMCAGLMQHPERIEHQPYLATVVADGDVVAAAIMTPPNKLVLSPVERPAALSLVVADLHRRHPACTGVRGPTPGARALADLWQRQTGRPYEVGTAQRLYQLDAVTPVVGITGALRRATEADRARLIEWLTAFNLEVHGVTDLARATHAAERDIDARLTMPTGGLFIWHDGRPVSMAAYSGPTPNGMRVGPVYTPPEHRGRGYARACVAAVSQHLLDSGRRYCFLVTDLSNPTSNHIYQVIGYRPVCDVDEFRFRP